MSRFLQIHALTSYPGALLNRDDAGYAKRLPFGGAIRTRVSSQCLKRHWRTHDGEHAIADLQVGDSVRSRLTFQRRLVDPLVAAGHDDALVHTLVSNVMDEVLGKSAKAKKEDAADASLKTGQITVLGEPEIRYLHNLVAEALAEDEPAAHLKTSLKHAKKNLQALANAAGLSAAMFGRMVTSDILARCDAAVHVAHAFTVHAQQSETDYFSAMDDLMGVDDESAMGSGHIGTSELTSGLYYVYVVVDLPLLVSNLTGGTQEAWRQEDRTVAADLIERLIHIIATVSPGAKLGSTAPYSYAQALLVESGNAQPRTLANAFANPIPTRGDVLQHSYDAMAAHLTSIDEMYGRNTARKLAAMAAPRALITLTDDDATCTVGALASWARAQVLA